MKLGIDFGTTRIVVASADRGNYPLVSFETAEGTFDWFPALIALRGDQRRYGWDAWHLQSEPEWTILRSIKRYLEDAGPQTRIEPGGLLADLLNGMVTALREAIRARAGEHEPLEIMLGVPANANSNQRFLTVDAFRRAGFSVLGLLNEPSAAAIEFAHRQKASGRLLVYDLGGGTFDVSLVELGAGTHTVIAWDGISNLGGDDFDHLLAAMALGEERLDSLVPAELFRFLDECRRQKEALHPNSRKIVLDLDVIRDGMGQVTVPVADYYDRCRPLLEESLAATARLVEGQEIQALYVTGGGSELPLVSRMLREEFGRKVKRSEYTRSATAIGLAIQADATSGYALREVFTRNFGVWRESDSGNRMIFDPIFPRGTRLPAAGDPPIVVRRSYQPVHNVGDFRYLEASQVAGDGQPSGDITVWDEILFPFDPLLADARELEKLPVDHSDRALLQQIEEQYACDAAGAVTVTIRNLTSHYGREFKLGRWSGKTAVVTPSARRRSRKAGT
ncbi:MAG TPA: Hsp70 family protein [Bryobacteraceae bacterium]|jgi:molecular chaperone DnaK|nr:Hsp70 family protein [Bryobacteraceae bacterium]